MLSAQELLVIKFGAFIALRAITIYAVNVVDFIKYIRYLAAHDLLISWKLR